MPAAAVIPAPIAYIKVVAVKKLVVEFLIMNVMVSRCICSHPHENPSRPSLVGWGIMYFTLKKSECFRQAFA